MKFDLCVHDRDGQILAACSVPTVMRDGRAYLLSPVRVNVLVGGRVAKVTVYSPDLDQSTDLPIPDIGSVEVGGSITMMFEGGCLLSFKQC